MSEISSADGLAHAPSSFAILADALMDGAAAKVCRLSRKARTEMPCDLNIHKGLIVR
jgi:hypothetical protein